MSSILIALFVFVSAGVDCATIAELIASRKSTLGLANAAIAANPEWSQQGSYALFIPTDAAINQANLPAGSLGSILVSPSFAFKTAANYQILQDMKSSNIIVYGMRFDDAYS